MDEELITINVWLAGRSYRIRIRQQEEAAVRAAVKSADEKIIELKQHYAGKDEQDFIAMCLLMYATDSMPPRTNETALKSEIERLSQLIDKMAGKEDLNR